MQSASPRAGPSANEAESSRRSSAVLSAVRPRSNSVELLLLEVRNAFDPHSQFIQLWHQLLLGCVVYETAILPFLATFRDHSVSKSDGQMVVVYVCESLFLADVYVELNTGFYEEGDVTRDAKKSRSKYLKSARFVLDIVALVPLSLLLSVQSSIAFLEMHKLIRVWRIPKYIAQLDDIYAKYFVVLKMFKVLLITVLLSHFLACIRFLFGYDEHHHDHWLPHMPDHEQSVQTKYLMSLYWSFGVMTGLFEGELPHTILAFIFTIFVAICGFLLFTYLCATFFLISKCESGQEEASEARINQFKHILSFHQVPDNLQHQAVEYLKRYYTYTEANDREAMRLLCPSIRKDVQVALLKDMVAGVVIFQGCSDQFIVAITSLLEMMSLPAFFVVFKVKDRGDSMYFVNSGVLHVIVDGVTVREERKGDFFGEMSIFLNSPRFATVVTNTYCTLYKLARFHIERVLEGYPEFANLIRQQVEDMARRMFSGKSRDMPNARLQTAGKKKTISSLLRRHIQKEKKAGIAIGWASAIALAKKDSGAATDSTEAEFASEKGATAMSQPSDPRGNTPTDSAAPNAIRSDSTKTTMDHEQPPEPDTHSPQSDAAEQTRKTSLTMPPVMHMVTAELKWKKGQASSLWNLLLLRKAIEFESTRRMWWILALQLNLVYFWFVIPTRLAFEVLSHPNWGLDVFTVLMDVALWTDIYFNFNLAYMENSEKIYDTTCTARRYARNALAFDVLCALPHWAVGRALHAEYIGLFRLLRIWRVKDHFKEVDGFLHLDNKQRLLLFGWLLGMLYHSVACLYFSITYFEGFSETPNSWLPSSDLHLRKMSENQYVDKANATHLAGSSEVISIGLNQYFRSLYYACYVLIGIGRPVEPENAVQFGAALLFMLSGFFVTAIVVDNVQKRFTASAYEQKEFFACRTRIQLFLMRQNAPLAIHKRVSAFLDYWWSVHRGAFIGSLLEELPATIKSDIMKSVCQPALQTLALLNGVRPALNDLEKVFIENVKFILYGQGEVIYRQGDFAGGMFFLLEGELCVISNGGKPRSITRGGFVGTAALQFETTSTSYAERVIAISGCIVLFMSREHLQLMRNTFQTLPDAMHALENRFMDPKFLKSSEMATEIVVSRRYTALIGCLPDLVLDPDSALVIAWEVWVFVLMTVQCIITVSATCFRLSPEKYKAVDIVIFLIEIIFMIDMVARFRLGFHEFGSKVLELRLIQKKYIHSRAFVVDTLALLPLFFINWGLVSLGYQRLEILNLNKLLRLLKVPSQFTALENKHLKFTLHLRLFKLVYFTFVLTHTLGCFWFDFRSHASRIHGSWNGEAPHDGPSTSEVSWLADASLLEESYTLQYFSSLFWSFGVMSVSYPGELPKTTAQCVFNITTLTCGFFLFAYVIGNFSDIIELMDAENREYYATLSSFRHLLEHFSLPTSIQERFKAYFFFKRFHSITKEHLLESCLPPSLLTDIRMIHLQSMIVKVPFLSGMSGSVTRMLVSQFSQVMIVKDEFVYAYGDRGSDMYFVFAGVLDTLIPREEELKHAAAAIGRRASVVRTKSTEIVSKTARLVPMLSSRKIHPRPQAELTRHNLHIDGLAKLNQITAGGYFGENALFMDSVRDAHVLAKSTSILYKLSRNSLETVFNRYPEWKKRVLRVIDLQQQQMRLTHIAKLERQKSMHAAMTEDDRLNVCAEIMEGAIISARHKHSRAASRREVMAGQMSFMANSNKQSSTSPRFRLPTFVAVLFRGAPAQSPYHLSWTKFIVFATIFMSIVVPYRISFDTMEHLERLPVVINELEILCEVIYIADIWVNWRIKRSSDSIDLYEQDHRELYKSERLVYDILAAFPLDYLVSSFSNSPLYRINRCLKLRNVLHYMEEINRSSIHKEMHRLRTVSVLYVVFMYWSACAYFAVAVYGHFGHEWNAWLPDASLSDPTGKRTLRLLRGCFFATTSFLKKGRTFLPDSIFHFVFAIIVCFIGLLTMAFMIGEFANLFISYIGNEVEYQKNHIAVEMYLGRWKISGELKVRTQAFLSSLWSSHRGVDYQSFLEDVPACIRTESILFIAQTPMRSFVNDIFVPLPLAEELDVANKSVQEIAQYLKFEGYPRGENVVVEGSITRSMYFVVRGHLFSTSTSQLSRDCSFAKGTYFGNYGLLGCSVSICTIRTLRACDLLSLGPDALLSVLQSHRVTNAAYKIATLAVETIKARDDAESGGTVGETEWGEAILRAIRQKQKEVDDARPNPDLFDYDSAVPTDTKAVEVLSSFAALERPIDAFGVFRPMLQLLVPNGQLHNIGGAKVRLLPLISTARKRAEFSSMEQDALIIIGRLFRKNDEAIAREATSSNKSSDIDESKTEESLSGADSEMAAGGLIPPPMIGRKSS